MQIILYKSGGLWHYRIMEDNNTPENEQQEQPKELLLEEPAPTSWMDLGDLGYKYVEYDDDDYDKTAHLKRAVKRALEDGTSVEDIVLKVLMGAEDYVDDHNI